MQKNSEEEEVLRERYGEYLSEEEVEVQIGDVESATCKHCCQQALRFYTTEKKR